MQQSSLVLSGLTRLFHQVPYFQNSRNDSPIHGLSDTIVGVLGGGQLGRMLCQAASQMAIKVIVLDPLENCPASSLAYHHMVGSFDDSATVSEFAKRCGVLTVEIEHVDVATLEKLEQQGVDCQPKASTIRIIQDKYLQKVHFSKHGVPLPEFMQIDDIEDAKRAGDLFGYPLMIKSRKLAYDGRGNSVAKSEEELSSAVTVLGGYGRGLFVEKWASFTKELSVIVARGRDNSISCYPAVETIHKENICHIVKSPADVPWKIRKLATDVACKAVSSLEGAGVFAVEMFLTPDSQILLNEVAPRPHNSGHHGTYKIRVNSIAPGLFKSEITEGLMQKDWLTNVALRTVPLKKFGTVDPHLTSLVRYLIHDSSEYVSGNIFIVDSGNTLPGVPIFSSL